MAFDPAALPENAIDDNGESLLAAEVLTGEALGGLLALEGTLEGCPVLEVTPHGTELSTAAEITLVCEAIDENSQIRWLADAEGSEWKEQEADCAMGECVFERSQFSIFAVVAGEDPEEEGASPCDDLRCPEGQTCFVIDERPVCSVVRGEGPVG